MFFPSAHRRVRSKSPLLENKFPACLLKTGGELLFVVGVPMGKGFAAATGVNSRCFALHIRSAVGTRREHFCRMASRLGQKFAALSSRSPINDYLCSTPHLCSKKNTALARFPRRVGA